MDENHQDNAESNLTATENRLWLPPLSSKDQEGHNRLQRLRKIVSQLPVVLGISAAFVGVIVLICIWFSLNWPLWAIISLILIGILLLFLLIQAGYNAQWTGFAGYSHPLDAKDSNSQRGKTLWNWLKLLFQAIAAVAVPISIIVGLIQFNAQQAANTRMTLQQEAANQAQAVDQERQTTLDTYLNDMSNLLLVYHLGAPNSSNEVRALAIARTDTALQNLDGNRKGTLIRFLWEAQLIQGPNPIIPLKGDNLNQANFAGADLSGVNLIGTGLYQANFSRVNLSGADLSDANLDSADLLYCDLRGTNLSKAILYRTYISSRIQPFNLIAAVKNSLDLKEAHLYPNGPNGLKGADLHNAYLPEVDLSLLNLAGANLSGAYMYNANLIDASLYDAGLRNANLSHADLDNTNLSGADLSGANLTGTLVNNRALAQALSLKGATMPDGSIHP